MSEHAPARRMTLSEIVDRMLTRSGERANSTVTLTRNAKGETQIEVTVRTGEDDDVKTVADAEVKAREVYDRLHTSYPPNVGHDNASIELTRNAKGETQIEVEVRTGEGGIQTIEDASAKAREVYEQARNRYPLASGHTGAQSSQAPSS